MLEKLFWHRTVSSVNPKCRCSAECSRCSGAYSDTERMCCRKVGFYSLCLCRISGRFLGRTRHCLQSRWTTTSPASARWRSFWDTWTPSPGRKTWSSSTHTRTTTDHELSTPTANTSVSLSLSHTHTHILQTTNFPHRPQTQAWVSHTLTHSLTHSHTHTHTLLQTTNFPHRPQTQAWVSHTHTNKHTQTETGTINHSLSFLWGRRRWFPPVSSFIPPFLSVHPEQIVIMWVISEKKSKTTHWKVLHKIQTHTHTNTHWSCSPDKFETL